jgi:predicted phage tail protein
VGGIFGGDSHTPTEAPNSLQSNSVAKFVDLLSEGEIGGLVNGLKSIYFDNVPLQNNDDSYNFQNAVIDFRAGLPDQPAMLGFSATENEIDVSTRILFSDPVVRTVTNPLSTSARVTIEIPSLQVSDASSGDVNPTALSIKIEVQAHGGAYQQVLTDTIAGKTTSSYERAYRFALPANGSPWNIRVTRLTADSATDLIQNQTFWASYTEIEDWQLLYPYSAYIGMQIDAQSFGGNIPARLYELYGIKIQVPTNYDPVAHTYATSGPGTTGGIWDGTFKTVWSNNPAWIFYDLVTNDRYGLGQYMPANAIDKFKLYEIGQYCDELVPDGAGGFEPRFTFNGTIVQADDAMRILVLCAGVFRGMVYWGSNGASLVADMPGDPVRLITPANVIDGTINYAGTALKSRHSVVQVSWYDPDQLYTQAIEVVEDQDSINQFGYRILSFTAVGCTSRGQAVRYGRWLLDTEKTATDTATWQASWDQADLSPGDIVEIADPAYAGVDFGGRLASITATAAGLDRPITLEAGVSYTISIAAADGTIVERDLIPTSGDVTSVSWLTAIDPLPVKGAIWVISSNILAPRQFRIISRQESDKHLFNFTALLHDPTKYDRIEKGYQTVQPPFTALPTGPMVAPDTLTTKEIMALGPGRVPQTELIFSWKPADARSLNFQVQGQGPNQDWKDLGTTNGVSIDLFNLDPGNWTFRVRAISTLGTSSPWATTGATVLSAMTLPPNDLENVRGAYVDGVMNIRWDEVSDARPVKYEIRRGDSWAAGVALGTVAHPPFETYGDGLYWISAYIGDDADQRIYALNPSEFEVKGALLVSNVVSEIDEKDAGWTGVLTGDIVIDEESNAIRTEGSLNVLDADNFLAITNVVDYAGNTGVYEISEDHYIDVGRVIACPINITWKSIGSPVGDNILADANILSILDIMGSDRTSFVDVRPEIAIAKTITGGVPDFAPYQKFSPGTYVGRVFKCRVTLTSHDSDTIAFLLDLVFSVDVPDRTDHLTGVTVLTSGLNITFTPDNSDTPAPFNGGPGSATVPNIQVTIHDAVANDTLSITSRTKSGCVIAIANGGVPVRRNDVDIAIQGY